LALKGTSIDVPYGARVGFSKQYKIGNKRPTVIRDKYAWSNAFLISGLDCTGISTNLNIPT